MQDVAVVQATKIPLLQEAQRKIEEARMLIQAALGGTDVSDMYMTELDELAMEIAVDIEDLRNNA